MRQRGVRDSTVLFPPAALKTSGGWSFPVPRLSSPCELPQARYDTSQEWRNDLFFSPGIAEKMKGVLGGKPEHGAASIFTGRWELSVSVLAGTETLGGLLGNAQDEKGSEG